MKKLLSTIVYTVIGLGLHAQEFVNYSVNIDGAERNYFIYIPDGLDANDKHPLVLNLHGLGSSGTEQMFYSGFNKVADAEGFIIAYPDGLEAIVGGASATHWNAGFGTGVDDIAFLDNLITTVTQNHNVDPARVYSTGMSNGGYMSYTLACKLSDRIAAIASVTGAMLILQQQDCDSDYVPGVMQIHGTNDGTVPFDGTPFVQNSIPDIVDFWANKLNCQIGPDSLMLEDIATDDMSTILSQSYSNCDNDNEVLFYTVFNGGHSWPGAFVVPGLGLTNQDIDAATHIWDFFSRHIHPNPSILSSVPDIAEELDIKLYPNPVEDVLFLSQNAHDRSFEVYDLLGFRRKSGQHSNNGIVVSDLVPGIYYLKLEGSKTVQFVRQ